MPYRAKYLVSLGVSMAILTTMAQAAKTAVPEAGAAAKPVAQVIPMHLSHVIRPPRRAPEEIGYFWAPAYGRRIAVSPDGIVYVMDEANRRVLLFGADGSYRDQFGGLGHEEGRLVNPLTMVRGPDGVLYIADRSDDHVIGGPAERYQRFDSRGRFLGDWWPVSGADAARSARLEAVAADGSLYGVTERDQGGAVVHHIAADGRLIETWDRPGENGTPFASHLSVACAPDGRVLVADKAANRVHVFSARGDYLRSWGDPGEGPGQLHHLFAIAVGPDGSVYTSAVGTADHDTVQRFDMDGHYLGQIGPASGWASGVVDLAAGRDGSVYLFRQTVGSIERYDAGGNLLRTWGRLPEPLPVGLIDTYDVGADGTVVVSDMVTLRRLDQAGDTLGTIDLGTVIGPDEPGPRLFAAAADGTIYGLSGYGEVSLIVHLAADGRRLASWPVDLESWEFDPDLAVGPDGSLYLADGGGHRVTRYDPQGKILQTWGEQGQGDGQFAGQLRVAIGPDGSVVTLDRDPWASPLESERLSEDRVQRFDAAGRFIAGWRVRDLAPYLEPYWTAHDVAVSPDTTVFVTASLPWTEPNCPRGCEYIVATTLTGQYLAGYMPAASPASWPTALPQSLGDLAAGPDGALYLPFDDGIAVLQGALAPAWRGLYFPDATWSAWPVASRVTELDLDWGDAAPAPGLSTDGFAARFERVVDLEAGRYRFRIQADGGVRLWVGRRLVVDRWDAQVLDETAELPLSGPAQIVLEYTDPAGRARVSLETTRAQTSAFSLALPVLLTGHRFR